MALSKYQLAFLKTVIPITEKICPKYGVPFQICVGQATLESGYGGSKKADDHTFKSYCASVRFNLFGIKGAGNTGTQSWRTREYVGTPGKGQWVTIDADFAAYSSLEAAVEAYCKLLSKPRYKAAREHFHDDPARYIVTVWSNGYATAPDYPATVLSVCRTIAKNGGGQAFDLKLDPVLTKIVARLKSVPFGKERRAQLELEMRDLLGRGKAS